MVRVCHMTSAHGVEDDRVFHKECVSLAKAGYEVFEVAAGECYDKNGVHIIGVGDKPSSRLKRMTSFAKTVYKKALELNCDIYHFHDPELLPYGLKLKKKGKKVIFDSHEKYTYQLQNKPYLPKLVTRPMAAVYGLYEKHVLKIIDAVVFPCTMNGKNPFEGLCKKTPIISNAAILDEFYNLYDTTVPKKEKQLCYVGGLTHSRGITADVQAAAKANAILALAGSFSPSEYEIKLRGMPEFSFVDYRGKLDRREVTDLLSESRIGLCTLLDEGQYLHLDTFGIKVFEYMSMALPVILSKSDYNCRMVDRYQFGICVDPENVDEIAKAICYLLDNPDEAQRMGENGRRAVKEELNWGIEEKKLLKLYEEIYKYDIEK